MNKNLKTDDLLRNRVFQQKDNKKIQPYELDLINSILENSKTLKSLISPATLKGVSLLGSNDYYDSYLLKTDSSKYVMKINSDDSDGILLKESESLKLLSNKNIAPDLIDFGQHQELSFLVSSYENGINFKQLPVDSYTFNLGCISKTFSFLHEVTKRAGSFNFGDFMSSKIEALNYSNIFPEDILNDLNKQSKGFVKHLPILEKLKSELLEKSKDISTNFSCLCHLNLDKSKILYRDGMVKFINFESSEFCDPVFDLVLLSYFTSLASQPDKEDFFLRSYYDSFRGFELSKEEFDNKVKLYKPIAAKFILMNIFVNFFCESLIHKDQRPLEFIKLMKLYELIKKDLNISDQDYISCENIIFNVSDL